MRDIMLVKYLRKGVKAAVCTRARAHAEHYYNSSTVRVLYLGKGRESWRRGDYGGGRTLATLDWYYRCNIVNNVPLSWCAPEAAFMSAQVTAPRRLHRGGQRKPPSTLHQRTLYKRYRCLLLNIHSSVVHSRCRREHQQRTRSVHTLCDLMSDQD